VKNIIQIVLIGLFGLWIIIIPWTILMKIKYFKIARQKEFKGTIELFSPFNEEFWIAGITWGFPVLGQDANVELNSLRKKANSRLFLFYLIVLIQILLVGLLQRYE
jgi:hypothetical protein